MGRGLYGGVGRRPASAACLCRARGGGRRENAAARQRAFTLSAVTRPARPARRPAAWMLAACLLAAAGASAQEAAPTGDLELKIESTGLGGVVRPGAWLPVRVRARLLAGGAPRELTLRLTVPDADGDPVEATRRVSLSPGADADCWLYAPLPWSAAANADLRIEALDGDGRVVQVQRLQLPLAAWVGADTRPVLVLDVPQNGLQAFQGRAGDPDEAYDRHQALRPIRGARLQDLPDRWWGFSAVDTLVWSPRAGRPDDPSFSAAQAAAIEGWVRRGGHLVITLPVAGSQAFWSSPLRGILPLPATALQPASGDAGPLFRLPAGGGKDAWLRLDPLPAGTEALWRDAEGRALAATRRTGFGRVTLMGVDPGDPGLARHIPLSAWVRPWQDVLGMLPQPPLERGLFLDRPGDPPPPRFRMAGEMAAQQPEALRGTLKTQSVPVGPVVLGAVVLFGTYFLVVGPVAWLVVRKRRRTGWAWVVHAGGALAFSAVAWGGAWLLRPVERRVDHVSFLDLDGSGQVRVQSELLAFVPKDGAVAVDLPADSGWCAGLGWPGAESTHWSAPRAYGLSAEEPLRGFAYPGRSAVKALHLDYLGPAEDGFGTLGAELLDGGRLQLQHNFRAPLRNLMCIVAPGDGGLPRLVGPLASLDPGTPQVLTLDAVPPVHLVRPAAVDERRLLNAEGRSQRLVDAEGYLGARLKNGGSVHDEALILSCFEWLPRPAVEPGDRLLGFQRDEGLRRSRGAWRGVDASPLLAGRRLLVLGFLENAALPAPLRLDGAKVDSTGLVVVRLLVDLPSAPKP